MKKIRILDLHGLSLNSALARTLNALYAFENSDADYLEIITGKGTRTLFVEVGILLDREGWRYSILHGDTYRVYY